MKKESVFQEINLQRKVNSFPNKSITTPATINKKKIHKANICLINWIMSNIH